MSKDPSKPIRFRRRGGLFLFIPLIFLAAALLLTGCRGEPEIPEHQQIQDGNPERGRQTFADYGCHSCHTIPGVVGADALVAMPLNDWGNRSYIAGRIPNTGQNLISWIMAPQAIVPGSAMPDMGVTWQDAKDMSAYLFTLRRR